MRINKTDAVCKDSKAILIDAINFLILRVGVGGVLKEGHATINGVKSGARTHVRLGTENKWYALWQAIERIN